MKTHVIFAPCWCDAGHGRHHGLRAPVTIVVVLWVGLLAARDARALMLKPGDIVAAGASAIFRVDPVTGNREIIADDVTGTGPDFWSAKVAVDRRGDVIAVATRADQPLETMVLRIDAATGNRNVIADDNVGTGPDFPVRGITIEPSGDILLLARCSIIRLDPGTGDRTVVSGDSIGEGPGFVSLHGLAVTETQGIFAVDDGSSGEEGPELLFHVNPTTGDRTIVSGMSVGDGPRLSSPEEAVVDANGNLLVISDIFSLVSDAAVLRVDPSSGDREIFTGAPVGDGPLFDDLDDIAIDLNGNVVLVDFDRNAIFRVDAMTGDRTILSDSSVGSGPEFVHLRSLAIVPVPEPGTLTFAFWALGAILLPRGRTRG
ncbi:MAG: hypothetical protein ACC628_19100 [Pirellulaceae bacterium]